MCKNCQFRTLTTRGESAGKLFQAGALGNDASLLELIRDPARIKSCYAQWEDVGPFRTDHATYVFGDERLLPNPNHGAGIDVSPAVRDYLGLTAVDIVDWRFVEEAEVPTGRGRRIVATSNVRNFASAV